MRIGVTGHRGKLGSELVRQGCEPLECDVTIPESVKAALEVVHPDVVIHCAAVGNNRVDEVETDTGWKHAWRVNVGGTANVRWMFSGYMISLSTSYVFDGRRGPYKESARVDPVNKYGWTKLAAEAAFLTEEPGTTVRTVGLYGGDRPDFAKQVVDALVTGSSVSAIQTVSFNPTYVPFLAADLIKLASMGKQNPPRVLNLAGGDILTRYEFALAVANVFGLDNERVIPVRKVDAWVAPRPARGGLRMDYARKLGFPIRPVMDGLMKFKDSYDTKRN